LPPNNPDPRVNPDAVVVVVIVVVTVGADTAVLMCNFLVAPLLIIAVFPPALRLDAVLSGDDKSFGYDVDVKTR
jgi:hypothetical protein